ncbi:MAG: preprotein translocase subunit SecD [Anaerolineaceae bacterium]|nr:MAG: preprotein translocase subunit SecD [Anaerolineaceae bacterium]
MKKAFLSLCVVALFASTLACSLSSLTGPRLTVTLAPAPGAAWDNASLELACEVLVSRLESIGVKGAKVTASPTGQIYVSLPKGVNLEAITPLLTSGAVTFVDSTSPFPEGADISAENLPVILTSSDIESTNVTQNNSGDYMVGITFTTAGAQKMADYSSKNIGHYLVIARDGVVISSPVINTAITGGTGVIQGNFTLETASTLAAQLISGSLPFPLVIVETTTK